jgi:hypothetical protein
MTNLYGTQEVNPRSTDQRNAQSNARRSVCWTTSGLTITCLRLLSDPGFPVWDVSYCYGEIAGEAVRVVLPFSQLDKRKYKKELFDEAKATGKFIKGLFNAISTLN